ncbi:Arylsulfatase [Pontiella desulfatans]|uniref:Arylsulfatase n=1 Tax=Pontiella desulfatans TaxID=2750659 RepID=A0A6C2U8B2_PONDE|nr:sulfatase-like hydrolase/transferase [Pontiella desulfatans]SPS74038.1 sulfatase S1_N.C [Kiritimatiellales bacterium]VGO16352.1 Arylsulfatase [Pontiella desulfatans]
MKTILFTLWCVATVCFSGDVPNVLLIVADDLGYSDLSCYGNDRVQTPNIDKLAEQGMRMTQFYAAGPVCTPTRASIVTGKYPLRYNIESIFRDRGEYLPAGHSLPQLMKDAGYTTALVGKWHLGGLRLKDRERRDEVDGPHEHGYEHYLCQIEEHPLRTEYFKRGDLYSRGGTCLLENEQPMDENHRYFSMFFTDIMGEETIRLINIFNEQDKPFFIHANFQVPHLPLERAPEPHWSATAEDGLSEEQHRIRSMLARLDYQIGRIFDVVEDNTLIIFTSDNGGHKFSNNGPWRGIKSDLYEGGIRVPFIVWWPGHMEAGSISDERGHSNDILPTLCAAAGIVLPADENFDGQNLLPLLEGDFLDRSAQPEFWYFDKNQGRKKKKPGTLTGAIRLGDWKLLTAYGEPKELYNLTDDPQEKINRMTDMPEKTAELAELLANWLAEPRNTYKTAR